MFFLLGWDFKAQKFKKSEKELQEIKNKQISMIVYNIVV